VKENLFSPQDIIPAFDLFLQKRQIEFSAIAIGGAALSILQIIDRGTRDLDLLASVIPDEVAFAARDFARLHALAENWLNNGPSSLEKDLPPHWRKDIQPLYQGQNLKLWTLSRIDLIRTKFWAMCDRMRDLDDLIAIAPTLEELEIAVKWVKPLDGNEKWVDHVDVNFNLLKQRLGYD
jgi:Nucleotidyltransferase of unknown function (DUF6036)